MKSLKFTSSVLLIAFLTSCSVFPEKKTIQVDYQQEDSRNLANRSADLHGLSFAITSYSLHTKEFQGVKPVGKGYFFVIDYTLHNYSDLTRSFDPKGLSIVTTKGNKHSLKDFYNKKFESYSQQIVGILPGEHIESTVVFEMPVYTEPDTLIVKGLDSGEDRVVDVPIPNQG